MSFSTDAEVVDVVKANNSVLVDASKDVVAIAGNGVFEAGQPVAFVTMKESAIVKISDVRFNDAIAPGHTINMIESDNASIAVYPNPVSSSMNLAFNVVEAGTVNVSVFDAFGKLVANVATENVTPGTFSANWDGTDVNGNAVAAGSYLVRIEGAGLSASQMFTVVR